MSTTRSTTDGPASVLLRCNDGSEAEVLTGYGFNCFRWEVPHRQQRVPLLWAQEHFASGRGRPSGSGIPILFPFAGRLAGTSFSWHGRTFDLEQGDGRGNAIHGFVHRRPWRVIARTENGVSGQFQASVDDAKLLECWPSDFRITATYRLEVRQLSLSLELENTGPHTLPCGLGLHPYFRLPLGGPAPDECLLRVAARRQWEQRELLPTGRQVEQPSERLESGMPFAEAAFDHVLTDLQPDADQAMASIQDPHASLMLTLHWDPAAFPHCVLFTPPHRQAVCIEPYTTVPDAFRLREAGGEPNLLELEPGQRWTGDLDIRVHQ